MPVVPDWTVPGSSSRRAGLGRSRHHPTGPGDSGVAPVVYSTRTPAKVVASPATVGPTRSSATVTERPRQRLSRSSQSRRVVPRTSTTWALSMGTIYQWLWTRVAGRVHACQPGARPTWTDSARMSYGSGTVRLARARVRPLGAPSTAAMGRTVHRTLVSRRYTRRCSKQRVRDRIAMRMMMPRVRLRVQEQTIPLHSALHLQGRDMVSH